MGPGVAVMEATARARSGHGLMAWFQWFHHSTMASRKGSESTSTGKWAWRSALAAASISMNWAAMASRALEDDWAAGAEAGGAERRLARSRTARPMARTSAAARTGEAGRVRGSGMG